MALLLRCRPAAANRRSRDAYYNLPVSALTLTEGTLPSNPDAGKPAAVADDAGNSALRRPRW